MLILLSEGYSNVLLLILMLVWRLVLILLCLMLVLCLLATPIQVGRLVLLPYDESFLRAFMVMCYEIWPWLMLLAV